MILDERPDIHGQLLLLLTFLLGACVGISIPRAEAGASAEVTCE